MKARAHVTVNGRVQGVFFRSRTKREGDSRDVKGWVRNRGDGGVEAVFEGEEAAVKAIIEFCRRGPPGAEVTKVDVVWEDYVEEFGEFEIKY
jgi:acylphosphatase